MKKIISNRIMCKHCGDIVESKSVHDYAQCSCGACAADGGHEYIRRTGLVGKDYEELSEFEDVTED